MSVATKCDRCGDVFEGQPERRVFDEECEHPTYGPEGREFEELCESCANKYDAFMDGRSLTPALKMKNGSSMQFTSPLKKIEATVTVGGSSPYKDGKPDLPDHMENGGRNY